MTMDNPSRMQVLAALPKAERDAFVAALGERSLIELYDWGNWARPAQLWAGDWRVWLLMAGRGFGKTRTGAEYIRWRASRGGHKRLALIGATYAEARAIMVEGESGLLNIGPKAKRPSFEPSNRRLVWPNGATAYLYSAEDPEALRGPQHHAAWCDELGKWPQPDALWSNLWLGLRLSTTPQVVVTTTPRPLPLLKQLLKDPHCRVTRGSSFDNKLHLPPAFLERVAADYAGTRLGRQELYGELLEDVPGALWTRAQLDACQVSTPPPLERVVVAVDPPLSAGPDADACGIIVAGRSATGHVVVLADHSVQGLSPDGWARAVLRAYQSAGADRVVAEVNAGGALVESLLRGLDPALPIRSVRAMRGKYVRAEPVAALYERGLVQHVGGLWALEDEMCAFTPNGQAHGHSPDRVDALVWALTELALGARAEPRVRGL
jgi:phage terminase large subunit-like protein